MRYTVSKCIPNYCADMSFPPRLSYWSNDKPSGYYSFSANICPVRHRSFNIFNHIHLPTSLLLPSHISSAFISIYVVPFLHHHARLMLSSPLTLYAISIISGQKYSLRLVVVPCRYMPSLSPSF